MLARRHSHDGDCRAFHGDSCIYDDMPDFNGRGRPARHGRRRLRRNFDNKIHATIKWFPCNRRARPLSPTSNRRDARARQGGDDL